MQQIRRGYRQKVYATFSDDRGDPAPVDGVPVWASSTNAFTVTPDADGMAAFVRGTGDTIGATSIVSVTADADLGEGVTQVMQQEEYQLVSGTASSGRLRFDPPEVDTTP